MTLLSIFELVVVGVADAGKPGLERIGLRPTQNVNLRNYMLVLAGYTGPHSAVPFSNTALWFGAIDIEPPSWIIVFTGPEPQGVTQQPHDGRDPQTNERVLTYYLRQPNTVFNIPGVMPTLLRIDGLQLFPPPTPPVAPIAPPREPDR